MTDELIEFVSRRFGVSYKDVVSRRRFKNIADARHVVAWLIRTTWTPQRSYPEIGLLLGRDHTTIIASVAKVEQAIRMKSELGLLAVKIRDELKAGPIRMIPGQGIEIDYS